MNIDGTNTLACIKAIEIGGGRRQDLPAAAHAGGQGPGPDLTNFYAQYARSPLDPHPGAADRRRERLQSAPDRAKLRRPYECILCACCSTSCPSLLVERRPLPRPGDPAAAIAEIKKLMPARRFEHGRRPHLRPGSRWSRSPPW